MANILESRVPLLEILTKDPNQEIAKAASAAMPNLLKSITENREWEAQESRVRDERFEW